MKKDEILSGKRTKSRLTDIFGDPRNRDDSEEEEKEFKRLEKQGIRSVAKSVDILRKVKLTK